MAKSTIIVDLRRKDRFLFIKFDPVSHHGKFRKFGRESGIMVKLRIYQVWPRQPLW